MVMQATNGKGQVIPLGNGKVRVEIPPAMLPRIQGPVVGLGDVKETLSGGVSAEIDSTTDGSTIGGISMAPGEEFEVGMVFQAPNLPEGETLENYNFDVFNQVDGETVGRVTFMVLPHGTNEPKSSTLYGVQDEGRNDSQFFRIDTKSNDTTLLGSVYEGYDIEALARHPETGEFYAASGDDGNNPGHLYKFTQTNDLTIIGDGTGFAEIDSLSFNPNDAVLWGWATGKGLITIDMTSGKGTLKVPYEGFIGDVVWNKQGNLLYAVDGAKLWIYNKDSQAVTQSNCKLPRGKTEALDMLSDDRLMFGTHGGTTIRVMNLNTCEVEEEKITTPFNDIEGIVSVEK
jgi:hypothetical protein